MDFKPTASQREAIYTVGRDLAVTAGAGSGKTRVLVERYLNLIEMGAAVEEIAAITFTRKAAQEMKERLRKHKDLAHKIERAQISTIHSLCQRIIAEHPLEAGIDPRFRLGEEWENADLLKQAVAEEVMQAPAVLKELGSKTYLAGLCESLYDEMLTKSDLRFWSKAEPMLDYESDLKRLAADVAQFLRLTPDTDVQKNIVRKWREEWPVLESTLLSRDVEFQSEGLDILDDYVRGIRGNFAANLAGIKASVRKIKEIIARNRGGEITEELGRLLERIHWNFQAKKTSLGLLDYNDLEQKALELLQKERVRAHYNFKHIMVDEFQDTNSLQKKLVDSLTADGATLFVVGDPKQSVYRFRGAEVEVFMAVQEEMEKNGKNVFLAENFRSRPELIQFANSFFAQLMQAEEIPFQASRWAKEPAEKPCVNILRTPAPDLNLQEARAREAEQVAWKIKELVEAGRYRYEDISMLFRVMSNVRLYEQALQAADVPYVNLSGRGFYSRQEIQDILNYLAWLEDEGDQTARFAVLRSPFYLLSDEGLYWLRQGKAAKLSQKEQAACEKAAGDYAALKSLSLQKGAPEVIKAILDRTDYVAKTRRLLFGVQKAANVEKFLEQSWELYARGIISLPEQLRYIHLAVAEGEREGEASLDAEQADVVTLRTVHGAKGLEFPVVFLPDTNGRILRRQHGPVLYHPDFGLTFKGSDAYEALRQKNAAEEESEAKRLLYVALTRAEEEIFFCGLDGPKSQTSWWSWLNSILPELPPSLYTEILGDRTLEAAKAPAEAETALPPARGWKPLAPSYSRVSFSVTALMAYARCPRCYFLNYILRVPEEARREKPADSTKSTPGLSALRRGNIVHRVCEQITEPGQLEDLVRYAALMEGVELNNREEAQLKRIIAPYLKSEFFARSVEPQGNWKIYKEKEFALPVENFIINGLVDQVFVGKTGIEVVDFKSNWIKKEQVALVGAGYQVQLRLYAWAMAEEFQTTVRKSLAYFLIPNEVYALGEEFLAAAATEQWIAATCRKIIAGAEVGIGAFPPGQGCLNCAPAAARGKSGLFGENTHEIRHLDWEEETF